jgi:hypothetical protein
MSGLQNRCQQSVEPCFYLRHPPQLQRLGDMELQLEVGQMDMEHTHLAEDNLVVEVGVVDRKSVVEEDNLAVEQYLLVEEALDYEVCLPLVVEHQVDLADCKYTRADGPVGLGSAFAAVAGPVGAVAAVVAAVVVGVKRFARRLGLAMSGQWSWGEGWYWQCVED